MGSGDLDWTRGLEGRRIAGKYRVRSLIGYGGMGAVFRAEDVALERGVAVKLLHPSRRNDVQRLERFRREAMAAARLDADGVVQVLEFGTDPELGPFQVLELLDGESLDARLERGPLSLPEAVGLARALASTLARVHEADIVHRDLKPANVFLQTQGSRARPVLLDFGVARMRAIESFTIPGTAIGTPGFMAPEQLRGDPVDRRADLYALGVLFHTCLMGRPPFAGMNAAQVAAATLEGTLPSLRELAPHLPEAALRAAAAATDPRPSRRVPDATTFAELLYGLPEAPLPAARGRPRETPLAYAGTAPAGAPSLVARVTPPIPPAASPLAPRPSLARRALTVLLVVGTLLGAAVIGTLGALYLARPEATAVAPPTPEEPPAPTPAPAPMAASPPSPGTLGVPEVRLRVGGHCTPEFVSPLTLIHTAGEPHGTITFSSRASDNISDLTLRLPHGPRTIELSTAQGTQTGMVISLHTRGLVYVNRDDAAAAAYWLHRRPAHDTVHGTVVIRQFDAVTGAVDLDLRGVQIALSEDTRQPCTLDGTVRTVH